jgi:hypothetical protein
VPRAAEKRACGLFEPRAGVLGAEDCDQTRHGQGIEVIRKTEGP